MKLFARLALVVVLTLGVARAAAAAVILEDYQVDTVFGFTTSGLGADPEDKIDFYNTENTGTPEKITRLPGNPLDITLTTSSDSFTAITDTFTEAAGWKFVLGPALAADSLIVRSYDPVHGAGANGVAIPGSVGAEFHVEYDQTQGSNPTSDIHWIQVFTTDHRLPTATHGHGVNQTAVDIATGVTNPYYDTGFAANSVHFYDFPNRIEENKVGVLADQLEHIWVAELFIATGGTTAGTQESPTEVTIYSTGIQWGWHNTPEPSTAVLVGFGCMALIGLRRRL